MHIYLLSPFSFVLSPCTSIFPSFFRGKGEDALFYTYVYVKYYKKVTLRPHFSLSLYCSYIRSQIEEDYGERLLKLSQLIVGQSEEGTLSESLSHIPSALETTARAHLDLAQQLKHHLETPLDGFVKEQRDIRRLVCCAKCC